MDEGRNMVLLFPTLLSFQDKIQRQNFEVQYVAPDIGFKDHVSDSTSRCHIFYPHRVVDIRDGKPKWAGLDHKSDLVEEV